MLPTKWLLGLLFCGIGVLVFVFLNSLAQQLLPRLHSYTTVVLQRIPPRLRRQIDKAAEHAGAAGETAFFVMEQSAMLIALVLSMLLPLPPWVGWGVGGLIVLNVVQRRAKRRLLVRRFEKQWPNCLDMLAMLMRSGLSFAAALHALAQLPSTSVAVRQLRQLQQQLHAGVSMEAAFAAMKARLPSPAFTSFAAAVLQARLSGSALTNTLMLQAEQARSEQQLAAEKFAQEVGVKLLLPLVTCFFPVTFLIILGPIFIGYFQS
ncbi:type II secretion system F family protein [Pseudidiomarina sp. CB1]|uniref:type II secretion system F family protein n=1 Tax=Pseudidiomarina sp. CB1 TaxID=2972484 RepID=UPI002163DF85|nr:type II secretion system F family protein [Pseudidiomarina sp. CB1]